MVKLFDQKKIWEIHDYNIAKTAWQEGFDIGYRQGLEIGIQLVVSMLEDFSFSKEDVIQKLASNFDMPLNIVEEMVNQYLTQ